MKCLINKKLDKYSFCLYTSKKYPRKSKGIFFFSEVIQSMNQDKTIVCKDCGEEFLFTTSEQDFYAEKGFTNEPTRCKSCRIARKNGGAQSNRQSDRQMYSATCATCGSQCQVPFQPRDDRPVYCSTCFSSQR